MTTTKRPTLAVRKGGSGKARGQFNGSIGTVHATATGTALPTMPEPADSTTPTTRPPSTPPTATKSEGRVSFSELKGEERITAMRAEIDTAIDAMGTRAGWEAFLNESRSFHRYSLNNRLLIRMQMPEATRVAGFNSWKNDHERTVIKGSKGLFIYGPTSRKVTETDAKTGEETTKSKVTGFRSLAVFDVSQTEGKPLAEPPAPPALLEGEAPAGMREGIEKMIESKGYQVRYSEGTSGANGYTSPSEKQVVINSTLSPRQQAKTLAHEAAHIALGHTDATADYHTGAGGKRSDMEVEAESVAFIISKNFGIDDAGDYSFGYIDHWAQGDKEKVRATADKVIKASREMLAELDGDAEVSESAEVSS